MLGIILILDNVDNVLCKYLYVLCITIYGEKVKA